MNAEVYHCKGKEKELFGVNVEVGATVYDFECKDEATADILAFVITRGVTFIDDEKVGV